ncbi:hypothetical protein C8R43DRAFT_136494 [Mycena crocata]|nr:hypothetical protein C8R43DRAFT_136494 [Mycena crocata]
MSRMCHSLRCVRFPHQNTAISHRFLQSTTVYGFLTSPSNVESAPTSTSAPPEALSPATENEVNRVFRTLTDPGPSVEIIASLSNNTPNPTTADTSDLVDPNSDQTILPPCTSIETTDLVPEAASITSMEGIEPTPLPPQGDSTRIVASTAPENVVINPPADPSAAFKAIIQSMISANKLIASSADIPSPTLPTPPPTDDKIQADGAVLGELTPNIPNTVEDDNKTSSSTKIGIQAATIIARHRGLKSGTINVEFSINKVQLVSIAKWNNRMKHPGDIRESLCITLLCISSADLETSESKDIRTLLPELECSWPKNGGLSMNALWNEQRMDFPMSPPFALPKNGFVDVSPFLVLGQNTFRITQTHDMSAYWLILCAHHPTPSQLHGVARHRHKERDWTGWLEKMSKPLQLPFRIPIEV